MTRLKTLLKKLLAALGLLGVAYASSLIFNQPPKTVVLRHETGGQVAVSVWRMPDDTIKEVKLTQAENDKFAAVGSDLAYDPIKPDPDAKFLIAAGGIPELDTFDGYAHAGDAYEKDGDLVVATSDDIGFYYSFAQATDPVDGQSIQTEIKFDSTGKKLALSQYDTKNLPTLEITNGIAEVKDGSTVLASTEIKTDITTSAELIPNHHSVTFDAQSSGGAYTSGTTITVSHTIANQRDRHIDIATTYANGAGQTISGVTYGATAATFATSSAGSASRDMQLWYLLDPPVGASSYTVTQTGSSNTIGAGAWSSYGADQTTAYRAIAVNAAGSGTSGTVTVNSDPQDLVVSVTYDRNQNVTPDATWTSDWNITTTGSIRFAGSHIAGASPSVTRTDTFANSEWGMIAASIKAAAPVPRLFINGQMNINGQLIIP